MLTDRHLNQRRRRAGANDSESAFDSDLGWEPGRPGILVTSDLVSLRDAATVTVTSHWQGVLLRVGSRVTLSES